MLLVSVYLGNIMASSFTGLVAMGKLLNLSVSVSSRNDDNSIHCHMDFL